MNAPVSLHVIVRGRVQGVGYRAFVEDEAIQRSLRGWVRNRRDGTVEAVLSGPAEVVHELIRRCGEGPRSARVEAVEQRAASVDEAAFGAQGRFTVLPTV